MKHVLNTINRNADIIAGNEDLELVYSFKNFPVFMGCVTTQQSEDLVSDMHIYISRLSGMLQLNPVLPLDIVYQIEHNPGTTGKGWLDHHKAFADFIAPYKPRNVFEIGGAHGILSQNYHDLHPGTQWTILEPNPVPGPKLMAKMIKGFFKDVSQIPVGTDMVVHSHVLEHMYEPKAFCETLSKLPVGTKVCFSVPALRKHLLGQFTNTLNFEHTYFCTEEYIEWMMGSYGFDLLDRTYHGDDHSVFYACIKVDRPTQFYEVPQNYQENKGMFINYIEFHETLIRKINKEIENAPGKVYLFGAHVFSQFLLSFGLNRNKIECILDNSPAKQGKRLYGTDLMVKSPDIIAEEFNPTIILRTGVFNQEIKHQILGSVNSNTTFLE